MFRGILSVLFFALCGWASGEVPASSRQVVLVTSSKWDDAKARVQLFEKTERGWQARGAAMDAMTGRYGMAWGIGLHRGKADGPQKKEGDGRAPAGVFEFGAVFAQEPQRFDLPCITIRPTTEGVDDPASRFYNRLVDRSKIAAPDWKSSEKLFGSPHYRLGIWVRHNPAAIPGAGSCIYLHEWVGDREGTAGCTILRRADLERLLAALKRKQNPVLIQMPEPIARKRVPEFFTGGR